MDIAGSLLFRARSDGRTVGRMDITSSRLMAAARLARGRSPDEAAALIPRLYSICGRAQGVAARRAVAAAQGMEPTPESALADELAVLAETAQETLWRLLLDWPKRAGLAESPSALADIRIRGRDATAAGPADPAPWERLADAIEALLFGGWLGVDRRAWDACGTDELARGDAPAARLLAHLLAQSRDAVQGAALMPPSAASQLADVAAGPLAEDSGFASTPSWNGVPAETGALSRQQEDPRVRAELDAHGPGAGARVLAKLVELAAAPERIRALLAGRPVTPWVVATRPGPGVGFAAVETARGILGHLAEVQEDRVERYAIVAPTEWNFQPDGPFALAAQGLEADGEAALRGRIEDLILAFDPCVPWRLEIGNA